MGAKQHNFPTVMEQLKAHALFANKALGQHFLCDTNLTDKIVRTIPQLEGATVLEIGPGPGGLTRSLLNAPIKRLIVIERDARFLPLLHELQSESSTPIEIIEGDALKISLRDIDVEPLTIAANLPYNISSPLLFHWLPDMANCSSLTLMFQKEVADRITAEPGSKTYGRLSVMMQWMAEADSLFDISPKAFVPPPKVWSSVVQLIPRKVPLYPVALSALQTVCQQLFHQRRKMLRQSMKPFLQGKPCDFYLEGLDIKETMRPEELSVEQIAALAERLAK